ncbi:MAG: SGNH/GDSL hydrolase family protein [Myxococcota bacterium]
MGRRGAALLFGWVVAAGILGAAEARFRADERSVVWLWDSGRRFATRPGVGGANAESFREPDDRVEKTPGVIRVAVLGDSMTWGTGAVEEAWPRVADVALDGGWDLRNFSHYGYDVAQSAAVLREHVWRYAPDLVVYAAYTNDPVESRVVEIGGGPVWVAPEGLFPMPLRRASALARRVEGALLAHTVDGAPDWAFYERHLRAMVEDAAAHDTPLLVLGLVPHVLSDPDLAACSARLGVPGRCEEHAAIAAEQERVSASLRLSHRSVLRELRDAAARGVDLAPPDRGDWQHPGKAGHAVIAEVAAQRLRDWDRGRRPIRVFHQAGGDMRRPAAE